ncbi:hypothetical protein HH214_19865 [Mucilaginibacter robiniae]|uniref:Tetratricopeptide repeat protein n=1 Tax=Mucilaginibacter robiniae TaxID=2728022 RepID=A0A7L5E4J7_9SPHI|nr:hypothetical protein [Mucilaginibacter robiniae]QJD97971.1 hypothetical protein HH214_19865 [Mucilaginibacter robiniae]
MKNLSILLFLIGVLLVNPKIVQAQTVSDSQLLEYYQNQRYVEALQYLKTNYQEPVTDAKALSRLAYTSQMAGKLAEAENYYQRVYAMDTTNLPVLNNMAGINMRRGNQDKAYGYYLKIVQNDTSNFYVYTQLAKICSVKLDSLGKMTYLIRANKINPEDADAAASLSDGYVKAKLYVQAEKVLDKAIAADSDNIILLESLENLTHAQKRWPQTIKTGMRLLQLGDNTYITVTKLAQAYYYLKNYQCCVETIAGLPRLMQTEGSYYWMGMGYKNLKDYPKAVQCFNKAIADGISSSISTYYGEIGSSYEESKQFTKSLNAYQKGLQFEDSRLIYYSLANLYDNDLKNKTLAIKYFKKYLAAKPPVKEQALVDYTKGRLNQLTEPSVASVEPRTSR